MLRPTDPAVYNHRMTRRLLTALCALAVLSPQPEAAAQTALETDGAAALGAALRRIGTTKRVLMIAAHPDDENTALIAELALGDGADVAYLSLTRGEGGQNLIGPELQEGLGLIRTGELLAARQLDGAQQFFTRAYDYGFSKSADEAFSHWPRDSLLADVVEVVRRYRPDIMVSIFSGTPADGHGQHQAAGIVAREAFTAAADPARFPAQRADGLTPHAPRYLFQAMWRPTGQPALHVSTGDLDPLFGRSRYQIAMQSRSRHRSQDMGRAEPIGPQSTALALLDGPFPDGAQSLFAALDTTLSQLARAAGADAEVVSALVEYEQVAEHVRNQFNPLAPARILPHLIDNLLTIDRLSLPADARFDALRFALRAERDDAADAVRLASGVVVDVVADTPHLVPGESFSLGVTVWNGGTADARLIGITPVLPAGWSVDRLSAHDSRLGPNEVVRAQFRVHVPADAQPSEPYFLRAPREGAMYAWPALDRDKRALPFAAAPARVAVDLAYAAELRIMREAEYLDIDKAVGEVRRPLLVLPRASVAIEPQTLVVPTGRTEPRTIAVTVSSAAATGADGTLRLHLPDGWHADRTSAPIRLRRDGEAQTVHFTVAPPTDAAGHARIRATFESGGRSYDRGYTIIDYPHIRAQPLFRAASVLVSAFAVDIADDLRVGYIEGAGDDGAAALRQLGATVEQLDAVALAGADLSRYDAIVAGIRAYEVRPDLLLHNDRMIEYARNGGTFVVQYNKYELVEGAFMPYPATMARPHGRVTDEEAPVTLLAPDHPLLSGPNRITAADFGGWVHERGLYYLDEFDERYAPLLGMADPGEPQLDGALVAARVGSGWYVYTGLALFRQLPEGVAGAYRLLANLASLGSF
jgi:LmbE family N-acetylglucosaminyl deacetylase